MIEKTMMAAAIALVASITLGLGSSEAKSYRKHGWHGAYNSASSGNYLRQRNRDYPRDRQLQGRL